MVHIFFNGGKKAVDIITIQVYITFIRRHLADKEVMRAWVAKRKSPPPRDGGRL